MNENDRCAVLLGAPIDDVTISEAVDRITAMVEVGRASGRVHQVATVNVDFVVNAANDDSLLRLLQQTDLAIPDGMPIVWGSRLVGTPLRERTTGVDILPALVERAATAGYVVCLFGAAPGVAVRAAELLRDQYDRAHVVGLEAPAVAGDGTMDEGFLDQIRALRPDIVGVALGNPKQEWWIARHGPRLGAPVLIGIGGTLDFLTGVTRRAPLWMQRAGLEWLHRAASEPRRLAGRYARDLVVFLPRLLAQAWRGRRRVSMAIPILVNGPLARLRFTGPTRPDQIDPSVPSLLRDGKPLLIDLERLDAFDNVTVATIVGLMRSGRRVGTEVRVEGVRPRLCQNAERLHVDTMIGMDQ